MATKKRKVLNIVSSPLAHSAKALPRLYCAPRSPQEFTFCVTSFGLARFRSHAQPMAAKRLIAAVPRLKTSRAPSSLAE